MSPALGRCQSELYAAEAESIGRRGIRWTKVAAAQAHVDRLVGSPWFAGRWPHFVHCAIERRGRGSVWSVSHPLDSDGPGGLPTEGVILVADGALAQPVLLHELAHLLVPESAGHGPAFAAVHLSLVRHDMGFDAYAEYLGCLRRRPPFAGLAAG
ncbi:MAG TPA: hypothetical protein VFA11_02700 [Acidimicrobiales bacterium]|nr:hypothetical protein [Acidimicrobiales bacterium]